MEKQTIWVYDGYNITGERPMNLNQGGILYVKRIFANPEDEEVKEKIIEFKIKVDSANICGYSIIDISNEPFDDPTVITSINEALEIANRQMSYIVKPQGKNRR